jgi:hypothetical protein
MPPGKNPEGKNLKSNLITHNLTITRYLNF